MEGHEETFAPTAAESPGAHELRIETFFAANASSRQVLQTVVRGTRG